MARDTILREKDSYSLLIEVRKYSILPADLMHSNSKRATTAKSMRAQALEEGGSSEQQEAAKVKISNIFSLSAKVVFGCHTGLHQPIWTEGEKVLRGERTRREFSTSTEPSRWNWRWEKQKRNERRLSNS